MEPTAASAASSAPLHPDCPCMLDGACCCVAARPLRHSLTLVSRWFECTADGRKSFEGRLRRGDLALAQAGDELAITRAEAPQQQQQQSEPPLQPALLLRRIHSVRHFPDFGSALRALPLDRTLPGVSSTEEGEQIYRQFYSDDLQRTHGVIFIESSAVSQPNAAAAAKAQPTDAELESVIVAPSASSSSSSPPPPLDDWHRIAAARLQLRDRLRGESADPQLTQSIMDGLGTRWQPTAEAAAPAVAASSSSVSASTPAAATRPRMLSFWLQPDPDSAVGKQLAACVQSLSAARDQPAFSPHVTLCSLPWSGEDRVPVAEVMGAMQRALDSVLSAGHSLRVRVEQLATHPTLPFVTLVLMLERTDALIALRQAIYEELLVPLHGREHSSGSNEAPPSAFPYMPHLSLLYDTAGRCSARDRERIVETECRWGGAEGDQRGREVFQNLEFDLGRISLVETTERDYAAWVTRGTIELTTGRPAQSLALPEALRLASTPLSPASDLAAFRSLVLDRLPHAAYLRCAFDLAAEAGSRGDGPFGALLVCDGQIVLSATNRVRSSMSHAHTEDCTAHAEMELLRLAARCNASGFFSRSRLVRMVLYASTEPCAMCAAAIVCSGIRSVVFGTSAQALAAANPDSSPFTADLQSPLHHARQPMLIVGPLGGDDPQGVGVKAQTS